jgi:hypothetical protein
MRLDHQFSRARIMNSGRKLARCVLKADVGTAFTSVLELLISQPLGQSVVLDPVVPVIHSQHQVGVLQPA